MKKYLYILLATTLFSCEQLSQNNNVDKLKQQVVQAPKVSAAGTNTAAKTTDTVKAIIPAPNASVGNTNVVATGNTTPEQLMQFAETQIGVPYVYGGSSPKAGFDCSGFITYVFTHFNIQVPRSSIDFTNVGTTVPVEKAKRGDIVLFTGTDSIPGEVGHMGLVIANNNGIVSFIHATSGKQMAVTISLLDTYYKSRFVRVCRVFNQLNA